MTAVHSEIRQAVKQLVHSQSLKTMRRYVKTAEEWYDGRESMMWKFRANAGQLDSEQEYQDLGNEAQWALKRCTLDEWKEPLTALANFGFHVCAVERAMLKLAADAQWLAREGVADHYISGVVQGAVALQRQASAA